jgi:protein-S-isoprenylcysteine O-methyltransferase
MGAVSWAAVATMTLGLATLGRWFTWNVEVQPGQQVVARGPYRHLRHPSYTGALLTHVGVCLLLHSWIAASIAVVALPAAFARRISHEEALLRRALPGYEAYARRTGGLLPLRLRHRRAGPR